MGTKIDIPGTDPPLDHYITIVKNSLVNIIRHVIGPNDISINDIIQQTVIKTHKIVIHTYQFLKLYLLYIYENSINDFPVIDSHFIRTIMNVITKKTTTQSGKSNDVTIKLYEKLTKFFNEHYKLTINDDDIIINDKLSQILNYEADDIIKNIETNIKEHFTDQLDKLIRIRYHYRKSLELISKTDVEKEIKNEMKYKFRKMYWDVKSDILKTNNDLSSLLIFHDWINKHKYNIIPLKETYVNNNIYHDIKSNPMEYLKGMIYINKEIEKMSTEANPNKLFNAIPLRTNIVPSYITLDTFSIINLFVGKNKYKYLLNIEKYKKKIWNKFFEGKKLEKNRYKFNGMIKTNGVGCSILHVKLDKNNEPIKLTSNQLRKMEECKEIRETQYIEKQENIKGIIENKNYVVIDPNKSDLMYCMDKNGIKFRYTQNQRRKETKVKRYRKIMKNEKEKHKGKEIETELSKYNSKTCSYKKFLEYVRKKNEINRKLSGLYEDKIFRKLKLNTYTNTQKSEQKMVRNFENKYGNGENTVVIMGDYDKGSYNMKGKEPAINKRVRKILRKNKYKVYLINEYNTSKLCCKCHNEVENFLIRKSKKPKKINQNELVFGLVRCKNVKCRQERIDSGDKYNGSIYNRDTNAVLNMLYIMNSLKDSGERPEKYKRNSCVLDDTQKDYSEKIKQKQKRKTKIKIKNTIKIKSKKKSPTDKH